MVASVPKHLRTKLIIHSRQPKEHLAVQTSCVPDHDGVISRWSPFRTCRVSTREKLTATYRCFQVEKEVNWHSASGSFSGHHRISSLMDCLLLCKRYGIERRRRRVHFYGTVAMIYICLTLFGQFLRNLEALRLHRTLTALWILHIEPSVF